MKERLNRGAKMRYTGKLVNLNLEKGYGFVNLPHLNGIYIRAEELDVDIKNGDEIEFDIVTYKGKPQGRRIIKCIPDVQPLPKARPASNEEPPITKTKEVPNVLVFEKKLTGEPRLDRGLHLYMPWNPGYIHNQMFLLRDQMEKTGHSWIPKINSTKDKMPFDPMILEVIERQLKHDVETCLYMTNFNCIHIWKISGIHQGETLPEGEKALDAYSKYKAEFWFKVSDVYVLQADHDGKLTPILQDLENLSLCREDFVNLPYNELDKITPYMSAQRYPAPVTRKDNTSIFPGVSILSIKGKDKDVVRKEKWLNTHRKVTKEYNLMREHLAKNMYLESWSSFNPRTQHFLIEMEMLKIESASYNSLQSMQFCKQKFECYISALVNEFDEVVGKSILEICRRHNITCLIYSDKNINCIEVLKGQSNTSPDLLFYRNMLVCGTWRARMKELFHELKGESRELVGRILTLAVSEPILTKLETLRLFRNWFSHDYFYAIPEFVEEKNKEKCIKMINQINTILNMVSSPYSTSNIFMDVYACKSKKTAHQNASIQDLLDNLKALTTYLAA